MAYLRPSGEHIYSTWNMPKVFRGIYNIWVVVVTVVLSSMRRGCSTFGEKINRQYNTMANTCGRCGIVYTFTHHCNALARRCLYCEQYGHYKQFCQKRRATFYNRAVGTVSAAVCTGNKISQHHGKKRKSPGKHQRDSRRYIAFQNRKSVCMAMPFYQVSDSELPNLLPKSAYIDATNCAKLNKQISAARCDLAKLQDERAYLQTQLDCANTELPKLHDKLHGSASR